MKMFSHTHARTRTVKDGDGWVVNVCVCVVLFFSRSSFVGLLERGTGQFIMLYSPGSSAALVWSTDEDKQSAKLDE